MAITSMISPAGVLSTRPIEAIVPLRAPSDTRTTTPETPTRPPAAEDLSRGLGPQQMRRMELREGAEMLRKRVVAEEVQRAGEDALRRLDRAQEALDRVQTLAQQAQNLDVPEAERVDLEEEARELARRIGSDLVIGDSSGRPEIAALAGFGFQPGTLGVVDLNRAADEGDLEELSAQAVETSDRVAAERERVTARLEQIPRPEQFPGFETSDIERTETAREEGIEAQRERLLTEDEARQVVQEIENQELVVQGEALVNHLATLIPDNVAALIP